MNKETLRMQMLAGVITESQYKQRLNESHSPELLKMLQDYIAAHFTADQGWGEDAESAMADMERIETEIIKLKGNDYFDTLESFANNNTYSQEYAGSEEEADIQSSLEEDAQKLGFTVDQLQGY